VAILAGVLWWRDASRGRPALPAPHLTGTLVYAARGPAGNGERLYALDLGSGRLSRGPLVREITDLAASSAEPGWLSLLAGRRAYEVRGQRSDQAPVLVAAGDRLSWTPGASAVVAQTRERPTNGGCPISTISVTDVLYGSPHVLYRQRECSGVLAVGSDQTGLVYLTLTASLGSAVYLVGSKGLDLLLPGYGMLSVSPVGAMIVEPQMPLLGEGPLPSPGAALFWRGRGGVLPIASQGRGLSVERVLAWSPDGSIAVVLGTMDVTRSLWLVRAGPGEGARVPLRIGPPLPAFLPEDAAGGPDAAVAADGSIYFSAGGHVFVWQGGHRTLVPLPPGAPEPAGPVAWLRGDNVATSYVRHPPYWRLWTLPSSVPGG